MNEFLTSTAAAAGTDVVKHFAEIAKKWTPPKKKTDEHWAISMMKLVQETKFEFDNGVAAKQLSKAFVEAWNTPQPKSRGLCFTDIYVNHAFDIMEKRPENDCYAYFPYKLYPTDADVPKDPYLRLWNGVEDVVLDTVDKYVSALLQFYKGMFYANEAALKGKFSQYHLGMVQECSEAIGIDFGVGENGKSMLGVSSRDAARWEVGVPSPPSSFGLLPLSR